MTKDDIIEEFEALACKWSLYSAMAKEEAKDLEKDSDGLKFTPDFKYGCASTYRNAAEDIRCLARFIRQNLEKYEK